MILDAKTVAGLRLPPDGKTDVIHFDDTLPGFGLRVRIGGKRAWVVQFRIHGQSRRMTIGSADVLGAAEARKKAKQLLAKATTGTDPSEERRAKVTLRSVADDYIRKRDGKIRPRSMVEVRRYLTGSYFRKLHALPIERIDRKQVASRIMKIEQQSGRVTAGRARSALSALFAWALTVGLAEHNPVIGSHAPGSVEPRDRVLTDAELANIWRACGDDDFGHIVKLLVLTGARRIEIGGMCWSELDLDAGVWTLPGERAKNHRTHKLPLPALAWDIIGQTPQRTDRDHLFGDRAAAGFTGWQRAKIALDARLSGSVEPWNLHDLRRTVATRMADIGVQPHIIEAVLNHASGHKAGVAGIYNRSSYQNEVRAALALWADHVCKPSLMVASAR